MLLTEITDGQSEEIRQASLAIGGRGFVTEAFSAGWFISRGGVEPMATVSLLADGVQLRLDNGKSLGAQWGRVAGVFHLAGDWVDKLIQSPARVAAAGQPKPFGPMCTLCEEPIRPEEAAMEGFDPMEPLSGAVLVHAECGLAQGLEVA